jgi:hypothetical protein
LDGDQVEALEDLGLVECPFVAAAVDDIGEVEKRTRDVGAGDVVDARNVTGSQRFGAMDVDAAVVAVCATSDRDVDPGAAVGEQLVEDRRVSAAQNRIGASCQHRSHVPALSIEQDGRHYGVDLGMDAMQTPPLSALVNRAAREAELEQLVKREHSMLTRCQTGDLSITRRLAGKLDILTTLPATLGHTAMVSPEV